MKNKVLSLLLFFGLSLAFTSCDMEDINPSDEAAMVDFAALATNASSGALNETTDPTTTERKCVGRKSKLTEVATSALPESVTNYITGNYAGATVERAGQTTEGGFVVLVTKADGAKAALLFDSAGTFVSEGMHRSKGTEVAIEDLPANIKSHIAATYSDATIKKAIKKTAGNYVVVIKKADETIVGLAYDAEGNFQNELTMEGKRGHGKKGGKRRGNKA